MRAHKKSQNTPGTAGGPGGHDRTLAIKSRKKPENLFVFHITYGYAKPWEFPWSGSKAIDVEEERRRENQYYVYIQIHILPILWSAASSSTSTKFNYNKQQNNLTFRGINCSTNNTCGLLILCVIWQLSLSFNWQWNRRVSIDTRASKQARWVCVLPILLLNTLLSPNNWKDQCCLLSQFRSWLVDRKWSLGSMTPYVPGSI